jgi:undecaprenyl-diphosphatase
MLGRLRRQKRSRRALWASQARTPLTALGALDQALLRALRTRGHSAPVEVPMKALGLAGEYGAVWMAIGAGAAAADRERRSRWLAAALVAPAAIVVNFAVKKSVGRQRPVITEHPPLARAPSKLSFPSAHATSSAAAAAAMSRVAPGARLPLAALATAICVGRPYLGMHYPSDVAAGALLGIALGRLAPLPPATPGHPPAGGGADEGSQATPGHPPAGADAQKAAPGHPPAGADAQKAAPGHPPAGGGRRSERAR